METEDNRLNPKISIRRTSQVIIDKELYSLLEYCVHRNDITEWNIQYSRLLLGDIDKIKFTKPKYKTEPTYHPAVPLPEDWRDSLVQYGTNVVRAYSENKQLEIQPLIIKLICWANLPDYILSDDMEVAQEMRPYCLRIHEALQNIRTYIRRIEEKNTQDKHGANLQGLIITGNELFKIDMNHIILSFANLTDASFSFVDMYHASMQETMCSFIRFNSVYLREADISDSDFSGSIISESDCSEVIGTNVKFVRTEISNTWFISLNSIAIESTTINLSSKTINPELIYRRGANFESANFTHAKLTCVKLMGANLKHTIFYLAELLDVDMTSTQLHDSNFGFVVSTQNSIITGDQERRPETMIDEQTNFTGTPLDSFRIDPKIKSLLQRNIRRIHWNEWYSKHKFLQWPVKLFWYLSSYGTTCKIAIRVLIFLLIAEIVTHVIFWKDPLCTDTYDIPNLIGQSISALFGFNVSGLTGTGVLISSLISLAGYFVLGVLITRFAIMFQSLTP